MHRLSTLIVAGFCLTGCTPTTPIATPEDSTQSTTTADEVKRDVGEAVDSVAGYTAEKKDELVKKFNEAQIAVAVDAWSHQ